MIETAFVGYQAYLSIALNALIVVSWTECQLKYESLAAQVADVKKNIETAQGQSIYPADQQMLIHQGKILKDDTTLDDNKIAENSFIVIMLSKVVIVYIIKLFSALWYGNINICDMHRCRLWS